MWRQHSSIPTTTIASTAPRVGGPRTAATHAEWADKLVKKPLGPNVWYMEKMEEDCRDEKDNFCREENPAGGRHLEPFPMTQESVNDEEDDVNPASWVQALLEEPAEVSMEDDEMSAESQDEDKDFELLDDISVLTVDSSMESLDWAPSPAWLMEESPFDLDQDDMQEQRMEQDNRHGFFAQATQDADLMSFLLAMCP